MPPVTPQLPSLSAFDGLLDRERSRAFHRGEQEWDTRTLQALLAALPVREPGSVEVQIVGSEGKTSTARILSAALAARGLRVGTFTSPHLHDAAERLAVDLGLPNPRLLGESVREVLQALESLDSMPSWFEALTATAAQLFARAGCQARVWEAGLGGRLDATTLLPAQLVVFSSVSLEHTQVLGDHVAAIAAEKAAALRPGCPVVRSHDLQREAVEVLEAVAAERACRVVVAEAPELGESCARSRSLARAACATLREEGLIGAELPAERVALDTALVPGRDELRGDVLFDGAHSVAACVDLAERLRDENLGWMVFGATSGRDAAAMLKPLLPQVEGVVLTRAPGGREQGPETLAEHVPIEFARQVEPDPERALAAARARSTPGRRILVTGSLYVLGPLLSCETLAP